MSQTPLTETYDLVVIGAGPVGENLAQYAVEGGLSAVLVEKELLGGECSYYACMPSKALLRPVQIAQLAQKLPGAQGASLNVQELLRRRNSWVSGYQDAGIDVVRGYGRLTGEKTVSVTDASGQVRTLRARRAVALATGSRPTIPDLYRDLCPWDNRDATGVTQIPDRLTIVGGGVVALEAATWMAALGSRVTLLVRGNHLLGRLGQDIEGLSDLLTRALEDAGVQILTGAQVTQTQRPDARATGLGRLHGGPVTLTLEGGKELVSDEILLATGRTPALDDLGLDRLGITVDDALAGKLPDWLHLIGDATGQVLLTHQGKYEARTLGAALAGHGEYRLGRATPVPQVIFTQPQVAQVGLTGPDARRAGHTVVTARAEMKEAAGAALLSNLNRGFAELTVDAATGVLLGAIFVGEEAAELLHAATLAVTAQIPVKLLRHAVPAYPTASEIWLRLLEKLPVELRS